MYRPYTPHVLNTVEMLSTIYWMNEYVLVCRNNYVNGAQSPPPTLSHVVPGEPSAKAIPDNTL